MKHSPLMFFLTVESPSSYNTNVRISSTIMAEQQISSLLSMFDAFNANQKLEITVQVTDSFHYKDTPPESSSSEGGSLSRYEERRVSLPVSRNAASPDIVSQLCFSTAMNSELNSRWKSQRLRVSPDRLYPSAVLSFAEIYRLLIPPTTTS
jgi:hypothetical protein